MSLLLAHLTARQEKTVNTQLLDMACPSTQQMVKDILKKQETADAVKRQLPDIACPVAKRMAKEFIFICETRGAIAPTEVKITANRYGGYDFRIYNSLDDMDIDMDDVQYESEIRTYPYPDKNLFVANSEFPHTLEVFHFRFSELFLSLPHKSVCPVNVALVHQDVLFAGIVSAVMKKTKFNPSGIYNPQFGLDDFQNQLEGDITTALFEGGGWRSGPDKISEIISGARNTSSGVCITSNLSLHRHSADNPFARRRPLV